MAGTQPATGVIALFGDVHGNLAGMYRLVERYSRAHEPHVAAVLQAGDIGAFVDPDRLDAPSRRHLAQDPSELGFRAFALGEKPVPIPTWFVAGNHEDFDLLEAHQGRPLDPGGNLRCLPNGGVAEVLPGVRVAGLWGISRQGPRSIKGDPRKYVSDEACLRLMERRKGRVDILLCHDAPWDAARGVTHHGSRELAEVVAVLQPRYVFHGHTSGDSPPWRLGATQVIGLNAPAMAKVPGRDGGMAILDPDTWHVRPVAEADL